jgi:hypothetical protein
VVHQADFSTEQLLINPEAFPELAEGDLVTIYHTRSPGSGSGGGGGGTEGFDTQVNVLRVEAGSLGEGDNGRSIKWFSVLDTVAELFSMHAMADVCIEKVGNQRQYHLGIIHVSFKDQYIASPDMWRLVGRFANRCTTQGMVLNLGSGMWRSDMTAAIHSLVA